MVDNDIPARCNCARLRRAARNVTRFYDACLAPAGLTANQFTLLGYLNQRGPLSMSRLAELLTMDRATMGHNLRPLQRDGLVTFEAGEEDRRLKIVRLSDEGRRRLTEARPHWNAAQETFESALGEASASEMRRMMDLVAAQELSAPVRETRP
jgi:DNA-binding MarR family transcriptional regulator